MNAQMHPRGNPLKMGLWLAAIAVMVLIGITTGFWLLVLPLGLFAFSMGRSAQAPDRR